MKRLLQPLTDYLFALVYNTSYTTLWKSAVHAEETVLILQREVDNLRSRNTQLSDAVTACANDPTTLCKRCNGTGEIANTVCADCDGSGEQRDAARLEAIKREWLEKGYERGNLAQRIGVPFCLQLVRSEDGNSGRAWRWWGAVDVLTGREVGLGTREQLTPAQAFEAYLRVLEEEGRRI